MSDSFVCACTHTQAKFGFVTANTLSRSLSIMTRSFGSRGSIKKTAKPEVNGHRDFFSDFTLILMFFAIFGRYLHF